jgi:hypothetical protein
MVDVQTHSCPHSWQGSLTARLETLLWEAVMLDASCQKQYASWGAAKTSGGSLRPC